VDYQWPQSHAEQTDVLRPVPPPAQAPGDEPTVRIKVAKKKLRRTVIIGGAVFGALAVLYTADLITSSGDVPRGVTVAGVDVGGQSRADAEQALHNALGPRETEPVDVRIGDADTKIDPARSGLSIDWRATLDRTGGQPLNPITRLTSLFTSHDVGVATAADEAALADAIETLRGKTGLHATEGGVRFDGIKPVAVEPKRGQELDVDGAHDALVNGWATADAVDLPVRNTEVTTTAEGVRKAVAEIAEPAVSGPVVVHGNGKDARLEPKAIARALTFTPDGKGGLTAKIDQKKVVGAVRPQLATTEVAGKDAEIVFSGGAPTVKPSVDGKGVDWKKSLHPLLDVLKKTDDRELTATYKAKPAKVTTAAAHKLGIKEVVGEFTTSGFASDSGVNIRTVAGEVDGAIVKPGDTFSLNGYTGPRTAAQGYVEAGVIENGVPNREVGGGISQFATTLYNAAYFAAMTDAGHKEHSYYISRYPAAREATVFQNPDGSSVIDISFTNGSKTGVAIQTIWTSSSITVKIWGTKHYEVESVTGDRTDYTEPETKTSTDPNCRSSTGGQGFTTSDTRIVKDAATGAEVSRKTRTVRYNSHPTIVCKPKPAR
jgi:vancomycin resistance protein YoaR